jgi:hypothetical protein
VSTTRTAPRDCPVCGHGLSLTRLSCEDCGTELSGSFPACDFCALSAEDRDILRVFLASRGNMKELERHLQVSYPTARSRFDGVLERLRIDAAPAQPSRLELLQQVARGEVTVDDAVQNLD